MREDEYDGHNDAHKKRKRRKRKLSRFAYLIILLVVALCAAVVCAAVFFKVGRISVSGTSPYSTSQIIKASGIAKGTSLLSINKANVEKKICTSLPYVARAKINFKLPSTVKIEVIADSPKYVIKYTNKYAYVDGNLKALEIRTDTKKYTGVITINGAEITQFQPGLKITFKGKTQATTLKSLVADIREAGLTKVTAMNVSDTYQLSVVYDNRITIVIGTPNGANEKLSAAETIIKSNMQPTDAGSLDVSSQNKRYTFSPS